MANWCYNDVKVYGSKPQVEKVLEFMRKALNEAPNQTASSPTTWIGQFIVMAGENWEDISCRGWIDEIDDEVIDLDVGEACFFLSFHSAWSPQMGAIDCAIDAALRNITEKDRNVEYVYRAEEPSNGVYINTDTEGRFFEDRYAIDIYDEFEGIPDGFEEGVNYFTSSNSVIRFLSQLTDIEIRDINHAFEICSDIDGLSMHAFENSSEV